MPNGNDAAQTPPQLPRDLAADFETFKNLLSLGIAAEGVDAAAMQQLARFGQLVHAQSAKVSLVAHRDRAVLYTRHILDSLNPMKIFSPPPASALDIGSGAGFPGIPLAIAWPVTRITVLESRGKKAAFLERVVRDLGLRNVAVVCARLEEAGRSWKMEPHKCVLVRALGNLRGILSVAQASATEGAAWVYFMGAAPPGRILSELGEFAGGASVCPGAFGGRLLVGYFPSIPDDPCRRV